MSGVSINPRFAVSPRSVSPTLPIADDETLLGHLPGLSGDYVARVATPDGIRVRKSARGARVPQLQRQHEVLRSSTSKTVRVLEHWNWPGGTCYDMPYHADAADPLTAMTSGWITADDLCTHAISAAQAMPGRNTMDAADYIARKVIPGISHLSPRTAATLHGWVSNHGEALEALLCGTPTTGLHGDLALDNILVFPHGDILLLDPIGGPCVNAQELDGGKLLTTVDLAHKAASTDSRVAALLKTLRDRATPEQWSSMRVHEFAHMARMAPYLRAAGRTRAPLESAMLSIARSRDLPPDVRLSTS